MLWGPGFGKLSDAVLSECIGHHPKCLSSTNGRRTSTKHLLRIPSLLKTDHDAVATLKHRTVWSHGASLLQDLFSKSQPSETPPISGSKGAPETPITPVAPIDSEP